VLDTDSWSWWTPQVHPPLPPIAFHAAVLTGDKVFIFGGSRREALYNDMIMLDSTTTEWQIAINGDRSGLPRRRRLDIVRGSGTRLLLFGGWDGSRTTDDMMELDTSEWLALDVMPGGAKPRPKQIGLDGTYQPEGTVATTGGTGAPTAANGFGSVVNGFGSVKGGGGSPMLTGGVGARGSGLGGGVDAILERMEAKHGEEMKVLRGEVARLKMANETMTRDMARMKALVGGRAPAAKGIDVEDLASRRDVAELRAELAKHRRQAAQDREVSDGTLSAQVDQLRRIVRGLEQRLPPPRPDEPRH